MNVSHIVVGMALLSCTVGCQDQSSLSNLQANRASPNKSDSSEVLFRLDKPNEDILLSFYVGGMLSQGQTLASILSFKDSNWVFTQPESINANTPLAQLFNSAGSDGIISWEEFEPVVRQSYYEARNAPSSLSEFKSIHGDWHSEQWFTHEVQGQMTHFRRKLSVSKENLLSALESMNSISDPIIYPIGTVFMGEHMDQGKMVEVTSMIKRADGFWDYFAYGENGTLISSIQKKPNPMMVPTQCLGCHFGDRLFEPERSFPAQARPGPNGERKLFSPDQMENEYVAAQLVEHAKRSDHILGLYGTLYLSGLVQKHRSGNASERERSLLERLELN